MAGALMLARWQQGDERHTWWQRVGGSDRRGHTGSMSPASLSRVVRHAPQQSNMQR
jgi:hypothetical protein